MASRSFDRQRHEDETARQLSTVFGDKGYCDDLSLRADELATLRRLTSDSWLETIRSVAPDTVSQFENAGIEQYHRLAHLLDHEHLWTTHTRTYSSRIVDTIRSFSLFDFFDQECPGYRICSAEPPYGDLGRPRINWRLVRPGTGTDIGPAHADYWFEAVLDDWTGGPTDTVKLKIWIPIYIEPGLTGFAYVPGSHHQAYRFNQRRLLDGAVKPAFDESTLQVAAKVLAIPCGTAVIFSYNLVHRGANSDNATKTRVSMETTLEMPRRPMEQLCGDLSAFY